jgi:hypothetical protein
MNRVTVLLSGSDLDVAIHSQKGLQALMKDVLQHAADRLPGSLAALLSKPFASDFVKPEAPDHSRIPAESGAKLGEGVGVTLPRSTPARIGRVVGVRWRITGRSRRSPSRVKSAVALPYDGYQQGPHQQRHPLHRRTNPGPHPYRPQVPLHAASCLGV